MDNLVWTALVTLIALALYFFMSLNVGAARHKYKVEPPAMTGVPEFERRVRVQANTLEWLPIFLPSLWLYAMYWGDQVAAIIGAFWVVGRLLYLIGYSGSVKGRGIGFLIQMLSALVLLVGALIGAVQAVMATL